MNFKPFRFYNIFLPEAPGQITKCCKKDEVLDYYHQQCLSNPDPAWSTIVSEWLPPRYIMSKETSRSTGLFNVQYSDFPHICNGTGYSNFQLFAPLFTDGTGVAVTEQGDKLVPYTCLDRNLQENGTEVEDVIWLLVCDHEDIRNIKTIGNETELDDELVPRGFGNETRPGDEKCDWGAFRKFYTFLTVVSNICLMTTAYVYIKIKETERVQGKIILGNVVATILVNLYLLIVYNVSAPSDEIMSGDEPPIFSCILLGYFGYFASLSMFSWMSVMCFNLVRRFVKMSLSQGSQKQFLIYVAVAIGFPLFLSLIAGILQVRY